MSQAFKPTPEQTQFGTDIGAKVYGRFRNRTLYISEVAQAVKDMVASQLAKEGWSKEDPTAALELDVER
jgi:hypothetical protein